MNQSMAKPADPSARFDRMEGLLQQYPGISDDDLRDLIRWFKKEASALEVASMTSKEAVEPGYRKFRADHIDRFSKVELAFMAVVLTVIVAVIVFFQA